MKSIPNNMFNSCSSKSNDVESRLAPLQDDVLVVVAGGNFGTGPTGIFSAANIGAASRLAGGIGLLYSSYKVGHAIGTALYNAGNRLFYSRR